MKIKWLGHASFFIETAGVSIVTDPYAKSIGIQMPAVEAKIVTVSHPHHDHNAVGEVAGNPQVIAEPVLTNFDGLSITGVKAFHDQQQGQLRGENIVFVIQSEGMAVCHLGDLGHLPDASQLKQIGPVDILLIPVGGNYTIDAGQALQVVELVKPRVTIPMHYKLPGLNIPIAPVEAFLQNFDTVVKLPFLEFSSQNITSLPPVVVLEQWRA